MARLAGWWITTALCEIGRIALKDENLFIFIIVQTA